MDASTLTELAAFLGSLPYEGIEYPALVFKELRGLEDGLVKRKLLENLTGWASLPPEERKARHLRALAIVGNALRAPGEAAGEPPQASTEPIGSKGFTGSMAAQPSPTETTFTPDGTEIDVLAWENSEKALALPLSKLKGIGPKRAETLAAKGLVTIGDLLAYLPYRYDLRVERRTLRGVPVGTGVLVQGHVLARSGVHMRRFPQAYKIEIGLEGNERVAAVWFRMSRPQQEFFSRNYPVNAEIEAAGQLDFFDGRPSLIHPELGRPGALERGLLPVYSETEGITTRSVRQWVSVALESLKGRIGDPLPGEIKRAHKLIGREQALWALHRPESLNNDPLQPDYPPRRRLVFDEFFVLSLGLLIRRHGAHKEKGLKHADTARYADEVAVRLPFPLTGAQMRAVNDIRQDLESGHPMHRLVQGDVGSGKTLVAFLAAAVAMRNGYQVALMAPTELLAEQHMRNAERYLKDFSLQTALLTGSTPAKARRELAARLQSGAPMLVVGTHALLEDDAAFAKLGLAIVDEQHRFGVRQRARLAAKGPEGVMPHFLVMTATPIPRTLAMTLYGDLDVSVIDELPPGRKPVDTKLVVSENDRKQLMAQVKAELAAGRQIYWVFPLIEESEKIELKDATRAAELLQQALPQTKVELLHGKMSAAEKDEVMGRFVRGESGVLVATTVIEVGVDVPNASLMVIEHADRFGLSQLHQLRGRVGRGAAKSSCYLRVDEAVHGDVAARLKVMTETNDGFRIAEADLEIRGSGDLLGTKQSGLPSMHIANPVRDAKTLAEARAAAAAILESDPQLEKPQHKPLRTMLETAWAGRLSFATAG